MIGKNVKPDIYLETLTNLIITGGAGSSAFRIGSLKVLESFLDGCEPSLLLDAQIAFLGNFFLGADLSGNDNPLIVCQIASCMEKVLAKVAEANRKEAMTFALFRVVARLKCVDGDEKTPGWKSNVQKVMVF